MAEPIFIAAGTEVNERPWGAFTVLPSCKDEPDPLPGRAACVTHGLEFRNNMERFSHLGDQPANAKPCQLLWWCTEHGMEEM